VTRLRELLRQRLGLIVTGGAGLLGLTCVARTVASTAGWPGGSVSGVRGWNETVVLLVFFVTIAVGELNRITLPGSRESAPMSVAAAYALAMTAQVDSKTVHLDASTTIATTALAMALPTVVTMVAHRPRHYREVATRFLGAATAAVLFRSLPLVDGAPLVEAQTRWESQRWQTAVAMVAVSALALVAESLVSTTVAAVDDHLPWRVAVVDELRQMVGLSTALAASGALIALAETALGVIAVPVFLIPLVLTQFAVRRYAGIRETYTQTIRTLSRLTEIGGYTPVDHPARVAELSIGMGRFLGVPAREVVTLEYAALLHDIGQLALRVPIPGGATMLAAPADQDRIAEDSAQIVRRTGVLDEVADILEVQARPYRHVRELGEKIPLAARIIKVANAYDDLAGDEPTSASRDAAIERIHLGLGYEYDPAVVDALQRVLVLRSGGVATVKDLLRDDPLSTEPVARS